MSHYPQEGLNPPNLEDSFPPDPYPQVSLEGLGSTARVPLSPGIVGDSGSVLFSVIDLIPGDSGDKLKILVRPWYDV